LLQEEAIAFQVRITGEAMRALLQQRLERYGIRLTHWSYLRVLWREDGISQIELSARVRRVGANTVSALNNLERMGLVRRVRNKTDRRAVNVFLTPAGKALEVPLVACAAEVQEIARAGIPERNIEILRDTLKAIRANLGAL
jgi:DNA-binding MarR family transcriptional regulator